MKLDLGCSSHKREGWIGLDIQEIKNVDIIGDAHHLPIRNDVVYDIISSKVFEHLNNPSKCVSECNRVLINHFGILTIGIPNIHGLRRFLRWAIKGKISVGDHVYCWGLPEIINLTSRHGFRYVESYLDTYGRYHNLGLVERLIRKFNNRIVDKNLNVVFVKE